MHAPFIRAISAVSGDSCDPLIKLTSALMRLVNTKYTLCL